MHQKPLIPLTRAISIGFETNRKGYIGFIAELPGAFIRGRTEEEAISKVDQEVKSYLKWLGIEQEWNYNTMVVQRHQSSLMVEDADNEILLKTDKETMSQEEFKNLRDLVRYSGETFLKIYQDAKFKDWVDEARIRKTFHGENPKTIQEIFNHVKACQYYYLSRTMSSFENKEEDFIRIRRFCLSKIEELYLDNNNALVFEADNEPWTLKKILRRFIWHDRIHGKAMMRILEKQRRLGIIGECEDPFYFNKLI
jgi:predicted RNase H-like HicB family nuclease